LREVPVPIVHSLELAAVDRDIHTRQQPDTAAQLNELGADLTDRWVIVLAEVGNRLVIWDQPTGQPHHFHVAPRFPLQPPA